MGKKSEEADWEEDVVPKVPNKACASRRSSQEYQRAKVNVRSGRLSIWICMVHPPHSWEWTQGQTPTDRKPSRIQSKDQVCRTIGIKDKSDSLLKESLEDGMWKKWLLPVHLWEDWVMQHSECLVWNQMHPLSGRRKNNLIYWRIWKNWVWQRPE